MILNVSFQVSVLNVWAYQNAGMKMHKNNNIFIRPAWVLE